MQVRVLVVEDSPDDMMLMMHALRRGGFDPAPERVETGPAMLSALETQKFDVVLSDYALPQFSGAAALALFRERSFDLPFIIVSGALGEERAVEMMKAGAHDYVLKHNLARLVPAVARELRAAEERRARRRDEATMTYLASIVESCHDAIVGKSLDGTVVSWNAGAETLYGYKAPEIVGRSVSVLVPNDHAHHLSEVYERVKRGERVERLETLRVRKDGSLVEVSLIIFPVKDAQGRVIGASSVGLDISKRKREEAQWKQLIKDLTQALADVKTLTGLLPICSSCKKIRDDGGYWQQVETYIRDHSNADFTHGICPDCNQRLYLEYKPKPPEVSTGTR